MSNKEVEEEKYCQENFDSNNNTNDGLAIFGIFAGIGVGVGFIVFIIFSLHKRKKNNELIEKNKKIAENIAIFLQNTKVDIDLDAKCNIFTPIPLINTREAKNLLPSQLNGCTCYYDNNNLNIRACTDNKSKLLHNFNRTTWYLK
jgi:hypothetical protein